MTLRIVAVAALSLGLAACGSIGGLGDRGGGLAVISLLAPAATVTRFDARGRPDVATALPGFDLPAFYAEELRHRLAGERGEAIVVPAPQRLRARVDQLFEPGWTVVRLRADAQAELAPLKQRGIDTVFLVVPAERRPVEGWPAVAGYGRYSREAFGATQHYAYVAARIAAVDLADYTVWIAELPASFKELGPAPQDPAVPDPQLGALLRQIALEQATAAARRY